MDYELAKQLKEAGFPQPPTQNELGLVEGGWVLVPIEAQERGMDKFYYSPNLSELIEACGDRFNYLTQEQPSQFKAINGLLKEYGFKVFNEGVGKTPEEAVARFWLKLKQTPKE